MTYNTYNNTKYHIIVVLNCLGNNKKKSLMNFYYKCVFNEYFNQRLA